MNERKKTRSVLFIDICTNQDLGYGVERHSVCEAAKLPVAQGSEPSTKPPQDLVWPVKDITKPVDVANRRSPLFHCTNSHATKFTCIGRHCGTLYRYCACLSSLSFQTPVPTVQHRSNRKPLPYSISSAITYRTILLRSLLARIQLTSEPRINKTR